MIQENHDETSSVSIIPAVPLRWYPPPEADCNGVDDDGSTVVLVATAFLDVGEVDTTLRLSNYPRPAPDYDDEVDATLSPNTTTPAKSRKHKRRTDDDAVEDRDEKKKMTSSARRNNAELPLLPIEQIPTLLQAVESRGGTRLSFLYRKKLEESDVKRDQNRLFVTRGERTMEFLTKEEAAEVDRGGRGLNVVGVDAGGNEFHKLGLRKWKSMNMIVINSDWWKVVAANSAKKGDAVEIWGFRSESEKPCLAFNFRSENGAGSSNAD